MANVVNNESVGWKVARLLRGQGYDVASIERIRQIPWPEPFIEMDLGYDSIGILEDRSPISIYGIMVRKRRAMYIGELWLNNEYRRAKANERWVLHVFGAEKFDKLDDVVRQIAREQKVALNTVLADLWPHAEVLPSDYTFPRAIFRLPPKYA